MPFPSRYSVAPEAHAKEPIDTDIREREKRAGDPPKDAYPNPEKGGPTSAPNPDNSTTPSSDQVGRKPSIDDQPWFMGSYTLELERDASGAAKWPLSFKRVEKDVKRPNKGGAGPVPNTKVNDQPPTAA